MNTYFGYKVFLDDLRPKDVKEQEQLTKAKRLEQKRQQRMAHSMDHNTPRKFEAPGGRAGHAAHSVGEVEANNAAQYEVEYPEKLKKLFEEDSSNESYDLPFEKPEHLNQHFVELEENNLSLIQQWQENEQQTEIKRKEFELIQTEKQREISNLKSTVEENKHRAKKIAAEKSTLEIQTSSGSETLMNETTYKRIVNKISYIRSLLDKKRSKASNQTADPSTQLVEIEGYINKVLKFMQLAKIADPQSVTKQLKVLQELAKTKKKEDQKKEDDRRNEQKAQQLEERKKQRK